MMLMNTAAAGGSKARTVLVVDDHPIVRRGVRAMIELETDLKIIGDAASGEHAVELADQASPDIVVIDLSMPSFGGIEAIGELRRRVPAVEILVFTRHQSDLLVEGAIGAGAHGFVCKAESDHLIPALQALARHETYFSPAVRDALTRESDDEVWDRRPLTLREQQVVKLAAEGNPNKAIARLLRVAVKTVETHRAAAMRKTGSRTIAALTLYAARNGLVEI
jgi:DNA-binding NarL/FixJ family response regulator